MDDNNVFVLLIQEDPADAGLVRQALARPGDGLFKLQCVESLPTALARIAGGGVDVIMLDLSLRDGHEGDGLTGFLQVRQAASRVPIVVLCAAEDEGLALRAMRAGAADYLIKERCNEGIGRIIRSAIEQGRKQLDSRNLSARVSRLNGGIIAFIGAKGGVGATTVALNVASALARRGRVILVEIRPTFGTLALYLRPYGQIRTIWHLLQAEAGEIGPAEAGACLWPCKDIPGLSVLFGPQTPLECAEAGPGRVRALLKALAGMADYVVADLPASLSDANRAAIESSGSLALVVERDPVCVQSAKLMARAIESWNGSPQPIEIVLVNRVSLGSPMPLAEIDIQLGRPALGVIPPGPDLCLSAQHAHTPLIALQPDSLVAGSLVALAEKCASFATTVPMVVG